MIGYLNRNNSTDTAPGWSEVIFQQLGFKYQSTTESISQCEFISEHELKTMGLAMVTPILEKLWEDEGDVWEKY